MHKLSPHGQKHPFNLERAAFIFISQFLQHLFALTEEAFTTAERTPLRSDEGGHYIFISLVQPHVMQPVLRALKL